MSHYRATIEALTTGWMSNHFATREQVVYSLTALDQKLLDLGYFNVVHHENPTIPDGMNPKEYCLEVTPKGLKYRDQLKTILNNNKGLCADLLYLTRNVSTATTGLSSEEYSEYAFQVHRIHQHMLNRLPLTLEEFDLLSSKIEEGLAHYCERRDKADIAPLVSFVSPRLLEIFDQNSTT